MNFDEENEEPITTPDTKNSTRINSAEGEQPELDKVEDVTGRSKWNRLSTLNTGAADSFGNTDTAVTGRQERAAAFDIIADHLYLPEYIHREGRNLMMDQVDLETLSAPGVSIHLIAFSLAAVLINEHHDERDYHPNRVIDNNDTPFVETAVEFEFQGKLIKRYMQRVNRYV